MLEMPDQISQHASATVMARVRTFGFSYGVWPGTTKSSIEYYSRGVYSDDWHPNGGFVSSTPGFLPRVA